MSLRAARRQEARETMPTRKPIASEKNKANYLPTITWRLPSGQSLADFALRTGFLVPPLALLGAAAGGILAVVVLAARGIKRKLRGMSSGTAEASGGKASDSIPYAPAIAAGAWLALAAQF